MKSLIRVLVLGCSLVSTAAYGDIFLGASAAQSRVEGTEQGVSFNADDLGYKLYGGLTLLKFFGLEAGYVDLGKPDDASSGVTIEGTGWDVFAMGVLPLGSKFEFFGKAGLIYWDTDATFSGGGSPVNDSDDGVDIAYGLGASLKFGGFLAFRFEWESFEIGNADEVDMVSIGLVLVF